MITNDNLGVITADNHDYLLAIPIGLAGVLICLWGLFGTMTQKPVGPPHM